jgi:hypothetical protein
MTSRLKSALRPEPSHGFVSEIKKIRNVRCHQPCTIVPGALDIGYPTPPEISHHIRLFIGFITLNNPHYGQSSSLSQRLKPLVVPVKLSYAMELTSQARNTVWRDILSICKVAILMEVWEEV